MLAFTPDQWLILLLVFLLGLFLGMAFLASPKWKRRYREEVTRREYHILDRAFDQMVARARKDAVSHRTAAMAIGVERVRAAKLTRGLFP